MLHPSQKRGVYVITMKNRITGKTERWRICGASFFKNSKHPKQIRDLVFEIMTTPYEGNRAHASLTRIASLFSVNPVANGKLLRKLEKMYDESFEKQYLLKDFFDVVKDKGGKITMSNWESIWKDMGKLQEMGIYGYNAYNHDQVKN